MTDLFELIESRRSVRKFTDDAVAEEQLAPLLEAMRWAPTAGNAQPLRFHVVRSSALRQRLAQAAVGQRFVAEAPVVIVVVVDEHEAQRAYGQRGVELYCLQDAAAATENLLLAAHAQRLGACWVGAFREATVIEALGLPQSQRPVALVPVGAPADRPAAPRRRPLAELVVYHRGD